MRKFFVVLFMFALVSCAFAEDAFDKQVSIGRDRAGMTWYLIDYGKESSVYYAVARKYYTSEAGKNETIEILTSRYSVKESKAKKLQFVEYRYEYSSDQARYAEVSRKYYDGRGNLLCGLEFTGTKKTYVKVVKDTIQSKGLAYATGKLKK